MTALLVVAAAVAFASGILVVTRRRAMHALVWLVLVNLSVAAMLFAVGAPFVGALQIVIYAGAIMVLFVFAVMLLKVDRVDEGSGGREWLRARTFVIPLALAAVLLGQVAYALLGRPGGPAPIAVGPKEVGLAIFGPYVVAVEVAGMLLLAGLLSAFHFGRLLAGREEPGEVERLERPALAGGAPAEGPQARRETIAAAGERR